MRRIRTFGTAALVAFVVIGTTTWATYHLFPMLWLHPENLIFVNYWSAPLAVLAGLAAAAWPRFVARGQPRWAAAVVVGVLTALVYQYFALRHTPLMTILSVGMLTQVLSTWVAAGASAMLTISSCRTICKIVAIAGLCGVAILVPRPTFNAVAHNQELTVAFVVGIESQLDAPGNRDIRIDETEAVALRKRVLELVRSAVGLEGDYHVARLWRTGEGKKALLIIVIPNRVEHKAKLGQPDGATVVYVHGAWGWAKHPPNVATLGRYIVVEPPERSDGALAEFSIADAEGLTTFDRVF